MDSEALPYLQLAPTVFLSSPRPLLQISGTKVARQLAATPSMRGPGLLRVLSGIQTCRATLRGASTTSTFAPTVPLRRPRKTAISGLIQRSSQP